MSRPSRFIAPALAPIAAAMLLAPPANAFETLGKGIRFENLSVTNTGAYAENSGASHSNGTFILNARGAHAFVSYESNPCRVNGMRTETGMIFSKRGNHSGSFNCEPYRTGTAASWDEIRRSGTFATKTSLVGNQFTLGGTLRESMSANGRSDVWETSWTGSHALEIRMRFVVSAGRCRVIEFLHVQDTQIDAYNTDRIPFRKSGIARTVSTPASTCHLLD